MQDASFVAESDITISSFVKRVANDFGMALCGAGDRADIGVSVQGTQDTLLPGVTYTSLIAAKQGTSCKIYGNTKTCEVIAGGVIAAGAKLKPDANAHAVVAGTAGDVFSAIANSDAAAAGERVSVTVQYGVI